MRTIFDLIGWTIIAIIVIFMAQWAYEPICRSYEIPEYLEPRSDGQCLAIGILLQKATATAPWCVVVTNDWWTGDPVITAELAKDLAKGY